MEGPYTCDSPCSRTGSQEKAPIYYRCFNSEKLNTNSLKIFIPRYPESAKMKLRKIVSLLGKEPRKKVKVKLLSRVRPRGLQPTRLLCPWDSPGKNTGVGSIRFSGDLSYPGIKSTSPVSPPGAGRFFTNRVIWEALAKVNFKLFFSTGLFKQTCCF